MKRQRHADPIVAALEDVFAPGRFIADQATFQFIHDLEAAIHPIVYLRDTEPQRTVRLFEIVLAGCYLKAEELDDTDFGMGSDHRTMPLGGAQRIPRIQPSSRSIASR